MIRLDENNNDYDNDNDNDDKNGNYDNNDSDNKMTNTTTSTSGNTSANTTCTTTSTTTSPYVSVGIQPVEGRILIFPHYWPHAGAIITKHSIPKIALRAELTITKKRTGRTS